MSSRRNAALILVVANGFASSTPVNAFQSNKAFRTSASFRSNDAIANIPVLKNPTSLYSSTTREEQESVIISSSKVNKALNNDLEAFDEADWEQGPTSLNPKPASIPQELTDAIKTGSHPVENQKDLGKGVFLTKDWRKVFFTYESPPDQPNLINPNNGRAEYVIEEDMIDGKIPDDLVGCLYRNGPGKFGVGDNRVQHILDADGLIVKVLFPPKDCDGGNKREFKFMSSFVETEAMKEEEEANDFLYRSTFGTGPSGFVKPPRNGLNEDPWEPPLLSKIAGNALKTDIKNSANTQVISFGGKLLALFEAGLPHELDPETLQTIGEDTLGGVLKPGSPVKLGNGVPEEYVPDFLGGTAHTAHPNVCPDTGNLVGWHWSQLVNDGALEVTFTEWSEDDFSVVATETFQMDNCELAPHDMALTENCIMLKVNSLKMNYLNLISGFKGPAASLEMDGRANAFVHVFPRPTAKTQFEPYVVEVPACFSIHFSHAYEDPETGHLVSYFSGWPPSDLKDFLGAWGGFAPVCTEIPVIWLWKLEIDPVKKECVELGIAPGSVNACVEHPIVHPNFNTKKAKYVYTSTANLVGDSSAPCGFSKIRVEDDSQRTVGSLPAGVKNEEIDSWFFGTRCFSGEPLIVPKDCADPENEEAAYLLGMVEDCPNDRSGVAIFDLERDLKMGPVAIAWLKSSVPHGLHGCFAQDDCGSSSVFC